MSLLFPLWQPDRDEYAAICSYLEIASDQALYHKVCDYLASAPFGLRRPVGFSRFLAQPRLTRMRVALLDPVTKLLFPEHPVRHALNAVLAIHECQGDAFRQLARSPAGSAALLKMASWGVGFALKATLTLPWLGWQLACYAVRRSYKRHCEDLEGCRVLIAGASRGLGLDILLECLERGAEVIGVVRDRESCRRVDGMLPAAAPARLIATDLAKPGALARALELERIEAASVDLAIWCAGVKVDGESVLSATPLRHTFEVNFFSAVEMARWLYSALPRSPQERLDSASTRPAGDERVETVIARPSSLARDTPHGHTLVLVSSMGRWHGMHRTAGYNASKAALSIWGESLEMELRQSTMRNCSLTIVEPGMFASSMSDQGALPTFLMTGRRELASKIVSGALEGKKSIRPPGWFALVTWILCLMGRDFRYQIFSRAKPVKAAKNKPESADKADGRHDRTA